MYLLQKRQSSRLFTIAFAFSVAILFIVLMLMSTITAKAAAGEITGTVFRDYDANGTQGGREPGVISITVSAYSDAGFVVSTTTNITGEYILSGVGPNALIIDTPYRIEFTGLPSHLQPGASGSESATSVTFVTMDGDGVDDIDLALQNPRTYCESNPQLATTCFVNGDPSDGTATGEDVVVTFSYTNSNPLGDTSDPGDKQSVSAAQHVGSVWGLAYDIINEELYASAFLKRHAGLGTGGLDAIYLVDPNTGIENGSLWLELNTLTGVDVGTFDDNATRDLTTLTAASSDPEAFTQTGKIGIGDIDISDDMQNLWVVNLYSKTLLSIDIASQTLNASYDIPNQCPAGTSDPDHRPFALKYHDGVVYAGSVCSGETDQLTTSLSAHVYQLPDDGSTTIMTPVDLGDPDRADGGIDLDYDRERAASDRGGLSEDGLNDCSPFTGWYPWSESFTQGGACEVFGGTRQRWVRPAPLVSNIEFDDLDGSIILSIMDRTGHVGGHANQDLDGNGSYEVVIGGDLFRVCKQSDGSFSPESEGGCGTLLQRNGTGATDTTFGVEEFYNDDSPRDSGSELGSAHMEASQGSIAVLPGSGEVVMAMLDPTGDFDEGGIGWFSNTDGSRTDQYRIFRGALEEESGDTGEGLFAKAAGLGDLVLLCEAAPIELGNRVWFDLNNNGIQDPSEIGIDGVTITLHDMDDGEALVGTATTSGGGLYYFGGITNTNMTSGTVLLGRDYEIRIDKTQSTVAGYVLSPPNAAQPANGNVTDTSNSNTTDIADSDALMSISNSAVISVTTGGAGANNHGLDVGFVPVDMGDLPESGTSYATSNANNGPSHLMVSDTYLGSCVDAEGDGVPSTNADGDDGANSDMDRGVCSSDDDEDGITFSTVVSDNSGVGICTTFDMSIIGTVPTGDDGILNLWIDLDGNGTLDSDEQLVTNNIVDDSLLASPDDDLTFNDGTADTQTIENINIPCDTALVGNNLYIRARFTQGADAVAATTTGQAASGEVEDYSLPIYGWDFGDAPNTNDQTNMSSAPTASTNNYDSASEGARHLVVGTTVTNTLRLGTCVDGEIQGNAGATAAGDDGSNTDDLGGTTCSDDDEDGLTNIATTDPNWTDGGDIEVTVNGVTETSCVYGWVDWDGDGFGNAGDSQVSGTVNSSGTVNMTFPDDSNMPSGTGGDLFPTTTYMRLRVVPGACSSISALGAQIGGEVEDYRLSFSVTAVTFSEVEIASNGTDPLLIVIAILFGLLTIATFMIYRVRPTKKS